ncbi:MAG TPA: YhjD/YihY/BrkB family envelope integrity protein, partial [Acidimicrobiia bacterium]
MPSILLGQMWNKIQDLARLTFQIFTHAAKSYGAHRVNRMSAAVAYRAIFALAPLLLLAVYVVGIAIGSSEAARAEILEVIDRIAGPTVLQAIETLLRDLASTSSITGIVSLVLLLWTSSSLFLELQNDL